MLTFLKQLHMWRLVKNGGDEGATAVEYGLMVALIAGVIVAAVTLLGSNLSSLFTSVDNNIPNSSTPAG